jgi:hypothetical protein
MKFSAWKTATIDISEDDNNSNEVDLEGVFSFLTVLVPTITSSVVTVSIAKESGGTYFPLYALDDDATGDFVHGTTAATTSKAVVFNIGGAQFVKVVCSSNQETADKVFYVRGFNP